MKEKYYKIITHLKKENNKCEIEVYKVNTDADLLHIINVYTTINGECLISQINEDEYNTKINT